MRGKREQNKEIAYTKRAVCGVALHVKVSANAWWMDRKKMNRLYEAFRWGCSIREACLHAKITVKQYKYFRKLHPAIDDVRDGFKVLIRLMARKTVAAALEEGSQARLGWSYLKWRRPEEFGPSPKNLSVCEEEVSSASTARSRVEMLMQEVISSMNQAQ